MNTRNFRAGWLTLCAALVLLHAAGRTEAAPPTQAPAGHTQFALDLFPPAPPVVEAGHAYFAVAGEYGSYAEALGGLSVLRTQAPDIRFVLFPPYGQWRSWSVMAAAYETPKNARFAVGHLTDRGLSTGAYLRSVADMAGQAIAWLPEAESPRDKIVRCLGQGVATIGAMRVCAGAIVTPASLTRCLIGGICTLKLDPANVFVYLATQGLSFESPLLAVADGALSPLRIKACFAASENASAAMTCLATGNQNALAAAACLEQAGEAAAACLVEPHIGADAKAAFACLQSAESPEQIAKCAGGNVTPGLAKTQECLARNPDLSDALPTCMPELATAEERKYINCVSQLRSGKTRPHECIKSRPEWVKSVQMGQCLQGAKANTNTILDCAQRGGVNIPGNVSECVAAIGKGKPELCAANATGNPTVKCVMAHRGNPDDLWLCMAQSDPKAKGAVEAYSCLSSGNKTAELLATCGAAFLPPETRQLASCLSGAGGAAKASAVCIVTQKMGQDEARLLNCAASSQGYASFGICAVAPQMNQEWRITAECVTTGGTPVIIAGCVAGRLTAAELQKCFTKGVGKDGCFGENNTIVVGLRNAANDITKGPGPNNEVVKAINVVTNVFNAFKL